ncbi:signal peptidase II [Desulfitobacterium sp. AusDCA]|uniref:signal peptidase II n=1 Tax=Desulfitobacterium sp. AusDCA TaxID=3240383 RepID=UPI003DA6F337
MLVWFTMLGVLVIDRLLKIFIQGHFYPSESLIVIPKVLHITYVLNPGAAFGLMAGKTWIFILTAILVIIGVIFAYFKIPKTEKMLRLTLGMIGGGALGNLYDRVVIGKVVDYLDFQVWPFVFNFADSMIVIGVGILLLVMYRLDHQSRRAE